MNAYRAQHNLWPPVHKAKGRGKPKNTPFTKKLACSLLRPDARINHFTWLPLQEHIHPQVGFLYDVNQLHQKQGKFIFHKDVWSQFKFWIGRSKPLKKKIPQNIRDHRATAFTFRGLQGRLNNEAQHHVLPEKNGFGIEAPNEMLMRMQMSALKAVFASDDIRQNRIRAFLSSIYLAVDYGHFVPTLVLDGKKVPYVYSQAQLEQDITALLKTVPTRFIRPDPKNGNPISDRRLYDELKACVSNRDESVSPAELVHRFSQLLDATILPEDKVDVRVRRP